MPDEQLTMFGRFGDDRIDEVAPLALCQCGCGLPAPLSKNHVPSRGYFKGKPTRFRRGHGVHGRCLDGFKVCNACGQRKPATPEFYQRKANHGRDPKTNLSPNCKDCCREIVKGYSPEKKAELQAKAKARRMQDPEGFNQRRREQRLILKREMVEAYGGKCSCCGIDEIDFLTLEHTNRDGKKHRKEVGGGGHRMYQHLKSLGWPKEFYTVFCFNCNCGSARTGICPHKRVVP